MPFRDTIDWPRTGGSDLFPVARTGFAFAEPMNNPAAVVAAPKDRYLANSGSTRTPVSDVKDNVDLNALVKAGIKSVLITVAGGNAPGQNAFLVSVIRQLKAFGVNVDATIGGMQTLLSDSPNIKEITDAELAVLKADEGSVFIGTSRTPETKSNPALIQQMAQVVKSRGYDRVLLLGGDGTLSLGKRLVEAGVPIIGIPKTMDGNLIVRVADKPVRVYSLGFLSSVEKAAEYAQQLNDWGKVNNSVVVLEINGRNTGWITFEAARKTGFSYFINEVPVSLDQLNEVALTIKKAGGGVLLVSESLEVFDKGTKIDWARFLKDQTKPLGLKIQEALSQNGRTVRWVDLAGPMKPVSEAKLNESVQKLLRSARSQQRTNIVVLRNDDLDKVALNTADILKVRGQIDFENLQRDAKEARLVLVADDSIVTEEFKESAASKGDVNGRVHYALKDLSGNISRWFELQGINSRSFIATHLLMAEGSNSADRQYAEAMAAATVVALSQGLSNTIIGFGEGYSTALQLPLDALQDFEINPNIVWAESNEYHNLAQFLWQQLFVSPVSKKSAEQELSLPHNFHQLPLKDYFQKMPSLTARGEFMQKVLETLIKALNDKACAWLDKMYKKFNAVTDEPSKELAEALILENDFLSLWFVDVYHKIPVNELTNFLKPFAKEFHDFKNRLGVIGLITINAAEGFLDKLNPLYQMVVSSFFARTAAHPEIKFELYSDKKFPEQCSKSFAEHMVVWISELVGNALKYRDKEREALITLRTSYENNELIVRVQDNGLGFERARGLKPSDENLGLNMGLGLDNIKQQVAANGGQVHVDSSDAGTQITLKFNVDQIPVGESFEFIDRQEPDPLDVANRIRDLANGFSVLPVIPSPSLSMPLGLLH